MGKTPTNKAKGKKNRPKNQARNTGSAAIARSLVLYWSIVPTTMVRRTGFILVEYSRQRYSQQAGPGLRLVHLR